MRFVPTPIDDLIEIHIERQHDGRGFFGRTYCFREFAERGLDFRPLQCSLSVTSRAATIRGFHFQSTPHREAKLVQCVAGRVFDVALDLRRDSRTFGEHYAVELSAENATMIYIPKGCAHAFQTMADDTAILYYISAEYVPDAARGIVWNDPAVGVSWPLSDPVLSDRDRNLPYLADCRLD
ncbi:MAG: dTDP-4-dehydrorhamnose 3,5-epimerase [Stellaceae bacterium]